MPITIGTKKFRSTGIALIGMLAAAFITGCTSTPPDVPPKVQIERAASVPSVRQIAPSATNPAITRFNDPHYVALDPAHDRADAPILASSTMASW